ncbi:Uncharacterised protein [Mycobacterium tuberculosis]|nr:Uncharacterised protein [Mycobacterium tuberculosis]
MYKFQFKYLLLILARSNPTYTVPGGKCFGNRTAPQDIAIPVKRLTAFRTFITKMNIPVSIILN